MRPKIRGDDDGGDDDASDKAYSYRDVSETTGRLERFEKFLAEIGSRDLTRTVSTMIIIPRKKQN